MLNNSKTILFYTIIFLYAILNLYISIKLREKKNKLYHFFLFFSYFPLWFILVFRNSSVGTDYVSVGENYTRIVNNIYMRNYNWFGIGLNVFCKVIGSIFGSNPFIFYFFIGTLTIIFLYKFLLNNCEYPTMSLFLFFVFGIYLQTFNQSRQMLAVIIVLYASRYIKEKSFIKYLIYVVFAYIFHESAIIFIPCYLLSKYKEKKQFLKIYLIAILIVFFGTSIFDKVISITKYSIYFSSQYNISNIKTTYLNLCVRVLFMCFCLLFYKKNNKDRMYNYCYHMIIICTLLQCITVKYYFVGRLTTYFFAFYIILLPKCIDELLKKYKKETRVVLLFTIIACMCYYFYVYYNAPSGALNSGYANYSFVWNKK